jgi:hypothetical protein
MNPEACCNDCCVNPNGCERECCDYSDETCTNEADYCCWDCYNLGDVPTEFEDYMECCCADCSVGTPLSLIPCCPEPPKCKLGECCKEECEWVFNTQFIQEATESCECVKNEIEKKKQDCLLDSFFMGCTWTKQVFGATIQTIVEGIIDECNCVPPPSCPISCDVMGEHVEKVITAEKCTCKCEDPYFGVQCDHVDLPLCISVGTREVDAEEVVDIRGEYFYSTDVIECKFTAGKHVYKTGAVSVKGSGTANALYGTDIIEYANIKCRTPPIKWPGYHYDRNLWLPKSEIQIEVFSDFGKRMETAPGCQITHVSNCYEAFLGGYECTESYVVNTGNMEEIADFDVCCRREVCSDWHEENVCLTGFMIDNLNNDQVNPSHDACCTNTPAPTNAPTWPPHLFVPKLTPITPWYDTFVTPVTVIKSGTPSPGPKVSYVPAKPGTKVLSYCLGFGSLCDPVYTNY